MAFCCVRCCRPMKHFPSRFVCILILILQGCVLDYYLAAYSNIYWSTIAAADALVIGLFIATFYFTYRYLKRLKFNPSDDGVPILGCVAWLIYSILLCIKVGVLFKHFSYRLDETTFFGENTLKTTCALAGVVFLLLLLTHHDSKPGSDQRKYIEELSGTVIFDILDGVDSMEILFDKEARDNFYPGLEDAIIVIACINFVLPTIPLTTLTKSKFGSAKLSRRMVVIHKVILAFLVNLPLLITRMIVWHGLGNGISIFSLKNIVVIAIILTDLYEHIEGEEKDEPKVNNGTQRDSGNASEEYTMENRFNYA